MGLFQSKAEKELALAINYLNQFLTDFMAQWDKKLKLMISAKAASEQPLEKVEPFMRRVWVETYKSAIELMIESEKQYSLVSIKTPNIRNYINHNEFKKVYSGFAKEIGESVGKIVREMCGINPEWSESLLPHFDEPLLSEFKSKAKEELKEYLERNSEYFS
jgi:hypothetical protein